MKVLISVDIEGVAGVVQTEQTRPGHADYERARQWMTAEANAAVAGAWWVSQSSSTLSARVMVGQIGQSVSSRSMEMARMREVSREGFGTGRT